MRSILKFLGIAVALAFLPQSAGGQTAVLEPIQYGGGQVLCQIGPDAADRYRGGRRQCYTSRVAPNGFCYCPSSAGPIEGDIVRQRGGDFRGGGYGYEPPRRTVSAVCRISPEASRFTGGRRDCSVNNVGPGGSCFCPSDRGPMRGYVVQTRGGY